jgi:hypothetical protein
MTQDTVEGATISKDDQVLLGEVLDHLELITVDVELLSSASTTWWVLVSWLLPLSQQTTALPMISSLLRLMDPVAATEQTTRSG